MCRHLWKPRGAHWHYDPIDAGQLRDTRSRQREEGIICPVARKRTIREGGQSCAGQGRQQRLELQLPIVFCIQWPPAVNVVNECGVAACHASQTRDFACPYESSERARRDQRRRKRARTHPVAASASSPSALAEPANAATAASMSEFAPGRVSEVTGLSTEGLPMDGVHHSKSASDIIDPK